MIRAKAAATDRATTAVQSLPFCVIVTAEYGVDALLFVAHGAVFVSGHSHQDHHKYEPASKPNQTKHDPADSFTKESPAMRALFVALIVLLTGEGRRHWPCRYGRVRPKAAVRGRH